MLPALKSEFRKLFTIRSTYIMIILSVMLIALFAFFFEGYKGNTGSPASTLQPTAYKEIISNAGGSVVLFVSIIAILFMAHEYRYNMIMYTLTANARRSRVLLAKLVVITVFAVGFGLAMVALAFGLYHLGLSMRGAELPTQDFEVLPEFGRLAVYYAAYALIAMLFAVLLRNIVGAIAILFALPITIEPLLGLVLKDNAVYLPMAATDTILGASFFQNNALTSNEAILVSGAYIVVAWAIAWALFLKRDAN